MSFAEARKRIEEIVSPGSFYSVSFEFIRYSTNSLQVKFNVYIPEIGHVKKSSLAEAVKIACKKYEELQADMFGEQMLEALESVKEGGEL